MASSISSLRSRAYALGLDTKFPSHAEHFNIPTLKSLDLRKANDSYALNKSTYFCGNSLGLMPKATHLAVTAELDAWADQGVVSHFRRPDGREPWVSIDDPVQPLLAPLLLGADAAAANASEVTIMNTLTGNLHTMLSAFYKPTAARYKILFEAKAFPSDIYAFQGQVKLHGFEIDDALIPLAPRDGEYTLRTEDIVKAIEAQGDQIAIVLFSAIQFYTGQFFDIETITRAGKAKNCVVGWDLAHAAGNVPLKLHDWDVDFAVFCSYKYLNAGPGGIGGIYVHERHTKPGSDALPRLAGWWGNNPSTRFQMLEEFDPIPGAAGFRMSNPSVLNTVCIRASLELFQQAGGIDVLRERSLSLTGYLCALLESSSYYQPIAAAETSTKPGFTIITPSDPVQRGAQLSLLFFPLGSGLMQKVFSHLEHAGIIGDERQPDVIRLAPNHFYNTHDEVLTVVETIDELFNSL
ncbi:hypothetical protein D0Z03_000723 [Geotrichum reessii]|nr:hypothetical protein D0Z03_000723 [Galactomyces reessii]